MPRKETEGATARKLDALIELARTRGHGDVSEAAHLEGRARFIAAVAKEDANSGARVFAMRATWMIAAAAVIALVAWGATRLRAPEWRVDGAVAEGDGFVRADATKDATIHYADGSDVVLAPASRARVVRSEPHHVVLEEGRVKVRVARGARLAFAIDAGPFTVRTKDAAMDVAWSGSDESLDVAPSAGSATVEGGMAGAGLAVRAGERLTAKARAGELKLVRADGGIATSIAPAPAPPASSAPPVDAPASSDDGASPMDMSPSSAPRRRSRRARRGRRSWRAATTRASSRTRTRRASTRCSRVARSPTSSRSPTRAATRRARRREACAPRRARALPVVEEARTAAFLLGRLADDTDHAPDRAIPWYDRYLREAPNGPFASDALGRKMVDVRSTRGADAARPIAEEYAQRFPRGAYASVAQELTQP